jgi:Ice-binding-like
MIIMNSKRLLLPAVAMLLVVLTGSCKKDKDASGPQVVNLGVAGDFVILSKSGITNVSPSVITGDIGTSPITGAAITGLTCPEVTGAIYSVDDAGPSPCVVTNPTMLTAAVLNMETAYTDAAGRTNPNFTELGAGNIGGLTLAPGLYKWTSAVIIPTDVTISGGSNDVWIFQVAGTLNMSSAIKITLSGGAKAKNIFWQTTGAVTLGTTSHFEGIILGKTAINLLTGASLNGKMLAQTAVTLQKNTVTKP